MKQARLLVLLCIALGLQYPIQASPETELVALVHNMPLEDRMAIEAFLRSLMLRDGGAFVLFGSKPVAFTVYCCGSEAKRYPCNISEPWVWLSYLENEALLKGILVWKKYRDQLSSTRFLIDCKFLQGNRFEICLIDRQKFIQVIEDNKADFEALLGKDVNPENLLTRYERENLSLFEILQNNEVALGIVLGFGAQNARAFPEHGRKLKPPFLKSTQKASQKFQYLLPFQSIPGIEFYYFLFPPSFFTDGSLESQRLIRDYSAQKEKIQTLYTKEPFLEATLKQLCLSVF